MGKPTGEEREPGLVFFIDYHQLLNLKSSAKNIAVRKGPPLTRRGQETSGLKQKTPAEGRGFVENNVRIYYALRLIQLRSSKATSSRLAKVSSALRSHTRGS